MPRGRIASFVTAVPLVLLLASAAIAAPAHQTRRPHAHPSRCGNVCVLAYAYPGWVCDIQGGVVAAGLAVVTDGANAIWNLLSGFAWTGGCHVIDDYILSGSQRRLLLRAGHNCFFVWSQPGRHGTRRIKCQSWYA
jgi:hypothetical protein